MTQELSMAILGGIFLLAGLVMICRSEDGGPRMIVGIFLMGWGLLMYVALGQMYLQSLPSAWSSK